MPEAQRSRWVDGHTQSLYTRCAEASEWLLMAKLYLMQRRILLRTHLNEQAKNELLAIANALGFQSPNHTLNKIISSAYQRIVLANTPDCEVTNNNAGMQTDQD